MSHINVNGKYRYIYNHPPSWAEHKFRLNDVAMLRQRGVANAPLLSYAQWALEFMRNEPQLDTKKFENAELGPGVKEGEQDCFIRFDNNTIKLGSMSNPYYSGEADNRYVRWDNLPQWFLTYAGNAPWQVIKREWQNGVLPLEQQALVLACQEFIKTSMGKLERVEPDEEDELALGREWAIRGLASALYWYQGNGYEVLNYILRHDAKYDKPMCLEADKVTALEIMQWAMTIFPSCPVYSIAYRYSTLTPQLKQVEVGDIITFKGYTSVSMNIISSIDVVNRLAETTTNPIDMVLMEIHLPIGSRFLALPSTEFELILPHYCEMQVLQKQMLTPYITYLTLTLAQDPTECSRTINHI